LGLGLVAFEAQRYDEAFRHFEQTVALRPERVDARVNMAVCLERLGRSEQARTQWARVLELSGDSELRHKVDGHLREGVRPVDGLSTDPSAIR
jgi:Flp pilus assembly protein TadD